MKVTTRCIQEQKKKISWLKQSELAKSDITGYHRGGRVQIVWHLPVQGKELGYYSMSMGSY